MAIWIERVASRQAYSFIADDHMVFARNIGEKPENQARMIIMEPDGSSINKFVVYKESISIVMIIIIIVIEM